ncbi:DUF1553 domain-containing protein [Stratiformator vulcanicus]|uniref:Planctomycete cytochrome C n=1 Tax=Stratiformator vulcanicus TaxID=2527980 RepID=A0A517R1U5_9PLAN|nr:DUF1553 domain-containing protein [Stratiformator vulcanicus]QDT37865.1 Planctomycete cytochrome C [Stratiformator vulcanicus]
MSAPTDLSTVEQRAEFERLLVEMIDGEWTVDKRNRLGELLRDEGLRETYVEFCHLHGQLLYEHGLLMAIFEETSSSNATQRPPLKSSRVVATLAGAAAVLAVGLAFAVSVDGTRTAKPDASVAIDNERAKAPEVEGHRDIELRHMSTAKPLSPDPREARRPVESVVAADLYQDRRLPPAFMLVGSQNRPPARSGSAVPKVEFNRDIRPILSDNCFACHGPDAHAREGELRLDLEAGAFDDREGSGAVITRFRPDESSLYERIVSDDEFLVMPPPDSEKSLTKQEVDLIRRWIEEGARWEEHWAFIPPQKVALPESNSDWARNPIDAFVLRELDRKGLSPSREADRYTLIRRVMFDLTGLPPTPEEVEVFVNDERPDAYERLVDRLLASPTFGEHRARYWLDAARYADTHGMHFDNYREIWPYRDWVVKAFNDNMPFDQFTVEQLAGDLLPEPSNPQLVATGFNRNNVTSNEGGSIEAELLHRYAVDRTETTATVFLGLTAGCAACHDHKFDPLSQREFYELYAFFNNTTQNGFDRNVKDTPPMIRAIAPDKLERIDQIMTELGEIEQKVDARVAELERTVDDVAAFVAGHAETLRKDPVSSDGLVMHLPISASLSRAGPPSRERPVEAARPGAEPAVNGPFEFIARTRGRPSLPSNPVAAPKLRDEATVVRGDRAPAKLEVRAAKIGPVARSKQRGVRKTVEVLKSNQLVVDGLAEWDIHKAMSIAAWVRPQREKFTYIVTRMSDQKNGPGFRFVLFSNNRPALELFDSSGTIYKVISGEPIPPGEWHHVVVTWEGKRFSTGANFYVDGELQSRDARFVDVDFPGVTSAPALIGTAPIGVDDVRLYDRLLRMEELREILRHDDVLESLAKSPEQRTEADRKLLLRNTLLRTDDEVKSLIARDGELKDEQFSIEFDAPTTLVMNELGKTPKAKLLRRGEYDQPIEDVTAGVPEVFPPLPEDAPLNRLGLARWLTEPDHPVMARVTVNRFWQQIFGTGIVKTAGDFGTQGEPPSHPELLDWLAIDFVEHGWDTKRMIKQIVMSATYRQASNVRPEHLEVDPENRYLARGPRFRLDAEMVRDQMLALSGLLVEDIGGPPVKPYQPDGLWQTVAYPTSNTANFSRDRGPKLYRRSLYTFWKRTAIAPNMAIFDAPDRESCIVRRERTNTPMQALVLMNDPQFVEAARVLAEKVLSERQASDDALLSELFYRVTTRPIDADELDVLRESLGRFRAIFANRPDAAADLLSVGEMPRNESLEATEAAAVAMVVNQLFNLDEVVTKQ